jgi:hypothetical protein
MPDDGISLNKLTMPVAGASGRLVIWADEDELARLRQLRAYQRKWPEPRYPAALTTPKGRNEAARA